MNADTDPIWTRIEAELASRGKNQAWLARRLGFSSERITNWKRRGSVPTDQHQAIATVFGESVDWLLGLAPPRMSDPDKLSRMALKIAQEFDTIADDSRQLDAFAAIIGLIAQARGR